MVPQNYGAVELSQSADERLGDISIKSDGLCEGLAVVVGGQVKRSMVFGAIVDQFPKMSCGCRSPFALSDIVDEKTIDFR